MTNWLIEHHLDEFVENEDVKEEYIRPKQREENLSIAHAMLDLGR